MKVSCILLIPLLHLSTVSGATSVVSENDAPMDDLQDSDLSRFQSKLGFYADEKVKAVKMRAQAAAEALEKDMAKALFEAIQLVDRAGDRLRADRDDTDGERTKDEDYVNEVLVDFGDAMKACDKRDCKRRYFFKEATRWVKKALVDIGVSISENPKATAALFIGTSVLVASLLSSGTLLAAALEAVGFGVKGPIAGSIAAAIQSKIGAVKVGSIFAKLQSAAMGGVPLHEIEQMATIAFAAIGTAGGANLIGAGSKPLGKTADFEQTEWKAWEKASRIDYSPKLVNKMSQFWGIPTAEGCVEYGYREYRMPFQFVPDGLDPVSICLQTPAIIGGVGFKKPLGCADEGPEKGVIGTWYVQSNETRCAPKWSQFEDEGCMQFGKRRMSASLLGLNPQDDWNSMCESTPARIRDEDLDGPTYCEDKGMKEIYGVFDMSDEKCECYCSGG